MRPRSFRRKCRSFLVGLAFGAHALACTGYADMTCTDLRTVCFGADGSVGRVDAGQDSAADASAGSVEDAHAD